MTTKNKWHPRSDLTTVQLLTLIMLFVITFTLIWNVKETRTNRAIGYHNRAVTCATVKGAIVGLEHTSAGHDQFVDDVFQKECVNSPVKGLYNNVAQ